MATKITKDLRALKEFLPNLKRSFNKEVSKELPVYIKSDISSGISPVKGRGRFQKYSDSYRRQIDRYYSSFGKRKSPVNMKLSGQMLSTLKAFVSGGNVKVRISDELADIHNRRGAGRSKVVRRLLPTNNGETFNTKISQNIEDLLIKIVNNTVRVTNRR